MRRSGRVTRSCRSCGAGFSRYPSQLRSNGSYCSVACANRGHRASPAVVVCGQCGKSRLGAPCVVGRLRYCSPRCANQAKRRLSGRKCDQCGAEFQPLKSSNRYCSLRCMGAAKRVTFPPCALCGATFSRCHRSRRRYPDLCAKCSRARATRTHDIAGVELTSRELARLAGCSVPLVQKRKRSGSVALADLRKSAKAASRP